MADHVLPATPTNRSYMLRLYRIEGAPNPDWRVSLLAITEGEFHCFANMNQCLDHLHERLDGYAREIAGAAMRSEECPC